MVFVMRWTLRCLPLIYMYIIWYQSSTFRPQTLTEIPSLSSMGVLFEYSHLVMFAILYLLLILALLTYGELTVKKELTALLITVLYSVIDEVHQHYVPYRSATLSDLLKNFIGIYLAWLVIHYYYFKSQDSTIGSVLKKITTLS